MEMMLKLSSLPTVGKLLKMDVSFFGGAVREAVAGGDPLKYLDATRVSLLGYVQYMFKDVVERELYETVSHWEILHSMPVKSKETLLVVEYTVQDKDPRSKKEKGDNPKSKSKPKPKPFTYQIQISYIDNNYASYSEWSYMDCDLISLHRDGLQLRHVPTNLGHHPNLFWSIVEKMKRRQYSCLIDKTDLCECTTADFQIKFFNDIYRAFAEGWVNSAHNLQEGEEKEGDKEKEQKNDDQDDVCGICLTGSSAEHGKCLKMTCCSKMYHLSCYHNHIQAEISRNQWPRCPSCRADFPTTQM